MDGELGVFPLWRGTRARAQYPAASPLSGFPSGPSYPTMLSMLCFLWACSCPEGIYI